MAISLSTRIGVVTVKEAFDAYEAGIDINRGPFVNKVYLCSQYAHAIPVINALMGAGPRPVRHACPESPNLRCISAVLAPKGEYDVRDGGRPQFNLPLIKAMYAIPTWEELTSDDPSGSQSFPNELAPGQPYVYMEQSIDFDTEVIKLPGRCYAFASDGKPLDTPAARSIGTAQFVLVRRWQTTLPYVNFTAYLNKLNNATFLGQPQGQIKFRKARTRRTATTDGQRTQEVELVFQWREYDHNAQHRPDKYLFELVVDSFGNNPYQRADLTQLLT